MGILELLYPARCPVCHGVIRGKGSICTACQKKLHFIKEPTCKKCGKEIEKNEEEYCRDCQRFKHSFDKGASVFAYDEVMRRSISMFKYHNRREDHLLPTQSRAITLESFRSLYFRTLKKQYPFHC